LIKTFFPLYFLTFIFRVKDKNQWKRKVFVQDDSLQLTPN